jgi:hypothetical protein
MHEDQMFRHVQKQDKRYLDFVEARNKWFDEHVRLYQCDQKEVREALLSSTKDLLVLQQSQVHCVAQYM